MRQSLKPNLDQSSPSQPPTLPITQSVNKYLWHCEKVRRMSDATIRQKQNVLNRFISITRIQCLSDITNDVFDQWIAYTSERNINSSSINAYNSIIVAMIRYYRELGLTIPLNIALISSVKTTCSERKYYTAAEVERTIIKADFETGLMIRIMFETGMRIAELVRLRISEFKGRRIRFLTKGRKIREVYVKPSTLDDIKTYISLQGIDDYLWGIHDEELGLNGEPPTTATVRRRLQKAFADAGFTGFYPHALRHSFATDLQKRGASIPEIKEMIGHTSIATTERYLHGFDGHLEDLFDKYR